VLFEKLFAYHTYYLIIKNDHFTLRLLETKQEYRKEAQEPMSTKSLLVGHMHYAKKLLKECCELLSQGFSFTKPLIVIHPTKTLKKELSSVEIKLYEELAKVIKARKVLIHTGKELTFKELEALVDKEDGIDV
jgi:hypothetical protein